MANCVFPQCGVQRIHKYSGIGLFKIPTRKCDSYTEWRNNLINVISHYRVVVKTLKERTMKGKSMYAKDIFCLKISNAQVNNFILTMYSWT